MRGPRSLRSRLLLSHLVVALAALGTILVGVALIGPGYFSAAMGHLPGDPHALAMDEATLAAFQEAVRTALVAGAAIALLTAIVLAFALSARVATPVTRLVAAAQRIAAGHYAERVPALAGDELGQLGASFNEMAGSLEAVERRRLELVGDVAHELRTPIATLSGYLEGLEDGVISPSAQTWALLRAETTRLARLTSDLSELWRAESRQLTLNPVEVDAATLVGSASEPFRRDAAARGIKIDTRVAPGLRILADRDRVTQVLTNYLSNALRFAPEGGNIALRAEKRGDEVVLSVFDDGRGLAPDELTLVFERFYRVEPSRSRASGGSGIGLAIVAALAHAMGGRAWAESAGRGKGATFSLALPRTALTKS